MGIRDIDPTLLEPHLSVRVVAALVHELDETLGAETVDAVLADVGVPRDHVSEPEHWVSTEFVRRFARALARGAYGLDDAPPHHHEMWQHWRNAGRHALRRDVIGPIYGILRAFGSPRRFYRQVPALHQRATRNTRSELRYLARGSAVIAVAPADGGVLESPNCWFQRGLFEAIPTLWGHPPAEVEHRECMLDPKHRAAACVYRVRFQEPRASVDLFTAAAILLGGLAGAPLGLWAGVAGAGIGAAIAGWRRYYKLDRSAERDRDDLQRLLTEADQREADLWEEHVALRRSMLVARKLSGYLSSDLTERIVQDPDLQLTLGGKHTDAAVLFVDIVGFTARSERIEPDQLVAELNVYFGHVDPNVVAHQGVIDKRIGDGIMAVFVPREDDETDVAVRALRCAMGMIRSLEGCNADLAARGARPFEIRIGIASGGLIQGNMGSDVRLEYTVIGDVVNLAARLESAASPGHALVPAAMLARLDDADRAAVERGEPRTIRVKGRTGVFDVVDLRPRSLTPSDATEPPPS